MRAALTEINGKEPTIEKIESEFQIIDEDRTGTLSIDDIVKWVRTQPCRNPEYFEDDENEEPDLESTQELVPKLPQRTATAFKMK